MNKLIHAAKQASTLLAVTDTKKIESILVKVANRLKEDKQKILAANALDLSKLEQTNPDYDRLLLTPERIDGIADDMISVAGLEVPYNRTIAEWSRPNGLVIRKVSVPFGVIGVIYEARPNVTADVFALCFKAGSACVLKGGHEADESSRVIVSIIHDVLTGQDMPSALCTLMPADRTSAAAMMDAVGDIDVIIPRGGRGLIDYVRRTSRVPVIETGAGVCHTYIDATADADMSRDVVANAKTRRVSVCNALDCLIVHSSRLADIGSICGPLAEKNVEIFADERAKRALENSYPSDLLKIVEPDSFGTEFRDYKMALRTVDSIDEAIEHIAQYGSHHSECIMSNDPASIKKFESMVDASCVYANASTAFTDGGQFGFGAEIGISTQKLHARGPMALPEMTTYKYIITGTGQTRHP